MDRPDFSVVSLIVLIIGLLMVVGGFVYCAYGGSVYIFAAGAIIAVAGIVLSYLDLRGMFDYAPVSKEPVGKKGGRR